MSNADTSTTQAESKPDRDLDLTIRATNGANWTTDEFKTNTKVKHVVKKSVDHFVAEGAMSPGDYRLALVVDGQAQPPLDEESELGKAGVKDGALLVLVPREPQVDG
jgi:hypothetical protein